MAFKYPAASISIIQGNPFYRINAAAIGGKPADLGVGGLIPLDVGFTAIAVGPDSDYEKYELYFPDPLAEGGLQQVLLSADRPFIGSIFPNNDATYPGANGQKQLAFVRPIDPPLANTISLGGAIVVPETDLIVYTGQVPPQLPVGRVAKDLRGYVPVGPSFPIIAGKAGHGIAGFGRSYFRCAIGNNSVATSINVNIFGMRTSYPVGSTGLAERLIETELVGVTAVAAGARFEYNHDSRVKGFYDYFIALLTGGTDIIPSDVGTQAIFLDLEVRD